MTKRKVLIVEDDYYIREALKDLLESEEFETAVAADGQLALDYLASAETMPGVILLDLMMPVKDGFAFRAEQLTRPRMASVPVVVMTADSGIEEKSERLGAHGRLRKPVDADLVLSVIEPFFK